MKTKTLIFIFFSLTAFAQDGLSVQLSSVVGTSISHDRGRSVPEKLHSGILLDISKMTFGRKYWQFDHGFPQMGLLLGFQSLGNARVYGNALTLLPYLEFNVYRFKGGTFQLKHGTGLAWVTKRFDKGTLPENNLNSTNLNATSVLDGGFRFGVNDRNDLKAGVLLRHISNGGFQKPNSGSNSASVYLNYTHYFQSKPMERVSHAQSSQFSKWRNRFMLSSGVHRKPESKNLAFVPQVSAIVFYQHNTSFRTGAGIEAGIPYEAKLQLAVYLEEEVQFSHITTRYGLGIYALNKRNNSENLYSKIGIAYYPKILNYIPSGFFIGTSLKAHGFNAAHIELSAGYTF